MLLVSIILPVYNSAKYLSECITSVLKQTYTNFELLLIDDGSTDKSGKICDEYAKKDARIKVFHKENGGVSSARNVGLENTKGEWICFIDSDDLVLENYIFDLVQCQSPAVDLVVQGFIKINNDNRRKCDLGDFVFQDTVYLELFEKHKIFDFGFVVSKLYRSSIIKGNNIIFPIETSHAEDLIFLLSYIPFAKKIVFKSVHNYHYISNEGSLVRTFQRPEVYYHQYFLLKDVLQKKYYKEYQSIYLEKEDNLQYSASIQFATLLKFIKAMYYHKLDKNERLLLLKRLQNDDLTLLSMSIRVITNPILFMAYTAVINRKYGYADQILSIYYKVVNNIRKR